MAGKSKNIVIGLYFNKKGWKNSLGGAKSDFQSFTSQIASIASGTLQTFANLSLAAGGISSAFSAIKNAVAGPLQLAMANEQAAISMEVLLGSADKASKLIADLKAYGAATPFEFSDLQNASKTLLSFGVSSGSVMSDLDMLGNVAGGNAQKLQSLSLAFGKVAASGKLTGGEVMSMIDAGFNPLQVIAQKTGESMSDLQKRMSAGGVSFDELRDAFVTATSEGGSFFQMNEKISQSLGGLYSTLMDSVNNSMAMIGEAIIEAFDLKDAITNVTQLSDYFRDTFMPVIKAGLKVLATVTKTMYELGKHTVQTAIAMAEYAKIVASIAIGYATVKTAIAGYLLVTKAITAAVWLWNNASKALAATQAFLMALTGPKGWLTVAAAGVAAAGAYYGLNAITDQLSQTTQTVVEKEEEAADAIEEVAEKSTAATTALDELKKKQEAAQKSAEDLVKSLQFDLETHGLSSLEKQLYKLWEAGASETTLLEAKAIHEQITALDELAEAKKEQEQAAKRAADEAIKQAENEKKALASRAKSIIDAHKTEQEIYEEKIAEIKKLYNTYDEDGNRLLSREQAGRAVEAAQQRLADSQKEDTPAKREGTRFGALATSGSTEAYKQIINHQFGSDNSILAVNKQQLSEQKKQTIAAQKTAEGVNRLASRKESYADLPA